MFQVILWTIVSCLASTFSVVITGKKALLSGNLLNLKNATTLMFSIEFILSMFLAVIARFSFILLNSAFLKIEKYQNQATTLTVVFLAFNYVFILIANYFILNETFTPKQLLGILLIIAGIFLVSKF